MRITVSLIRAAERAPERLATVCGQRRRTWSEILERTRRAAGALRAHGLRRGERVAVLAMNSDRYVELLYAVAWCGGVLVPLNVRWANLENIAALTDCGACILCVDDTFSASADALREAVPSLKQVIHIGEASISADALSYEALLEESAPVDDAGGGEDDLYAVFYTGGTTGQTKGVMLSHGNAFAVTIGWLASLPLDLPPVHLHVGGMFHLSGAGYAWLTTMAEGTHVLLPKFEPLPVMRAIEAHRVTSSMMMPTMVNMLLTHPEFATHDLSSVRTCIYGGSPIPDRLLEAAIRDLPGWGFVHSYGMTETSGMTLMLPAEHCKPGNPLLRSCGRASPTAEVMIAGPDGNELPHDTVGEILMRGRMVMEGYWNDESASKQALRDGWMHSGDAAWRVKRGFFYIVDRIKDMIVSGGENVYSAEVENALSHHPGILECAVIGTPDERWGERVTAMVVAREGSVLDEDSLIAHCRSLIANYKCPRTVVFREDLPKTAAGKIDKTRLRAPYWSGLDRLVN